MARKDTTGSNPSPASQTFTSLEVSQIAQVSLRQLQWWDERKVLSLTHEGRKRSYRPRDVIEVLVVAELRRKGMSLQSVRRAIRFWRREMEERLAPVISGDIDLYLVTDGKVTSIEDDQAAVIARLKSARKPMMLICIGDQTKRLRKFQGGPRTRKVRRKQPRAVERQLTLFS